MLKYFLKKRLIKDLEYTEDIDYSNINLDKYSFTTGYSNGFVKGFYYSNKLFYIINGIGIILIILLLIIS